MVTADGAAFATFTVAVSVPLPRLPVADKRAL